MSRKLDIDKDVTAWFSGYDSVMNGQQPTCPRCVSDDVEVTKDAYDNGVGFMLITCNQCGKSGYYSRVIFK